MRANLVPFESPSLRIRRVRCRAPMHGCRAVEYAGTSTLVLPQAGLFVKHEARHSAFVADPLHGVFFTAGEPYRVSHPTAHGDDCLVLEYRAATLPRVLEEVDPSVLDTPSRPFRTAGVRLDPETVLRRRLLSHRLSRGLAEPLEVEEEAFAVFAAAIAAGRGPSSMGLPKRRNRKHEDLVHATQAAIADDPVRRWSLDALAGLARCSPFHLARMFRAHAGIPIHRYVVQARLTLALDAILDSARSLSAIAMDAGFAHHSHFTEAFHRAFGMRPSALRRGAPAPPAAAWSVGRPKTSAVRS